MVTLYPHRMHEIDGQEVIAVQQVLDPEHVAAITASMKKNGWIGPPVITFRGLILTGNHRCAAADEAGIEIESIDLLDLLAAEGVNIATIAEVMEDHDPKLYNNYQLAEDLAGLIPGREHERLGIDFGIHN